MRVTAILASLLLIAVSAFAQQSGYSFSCSGGYFNSGSFLNSDCEDGTGTTFWTYINLDWCVTNYFGTLYCKDGWVSLQFGASIMERS